MPIEEHLRRFRKRLAPLDTLASRHQHRDSLVTAFVRALAASDSAALAAMLLTPAEYAWLYYPAHIYARPPYQLDPGTFWGMIQGNSIKGFNRLLRERGQSQLALRSYCCAAVMTLSEPAHEWNACRLDLKVGGVRRTEQLFGSIVEIGGRYKFVSYANQF